MKKILILFIFIVNLFAMQDKYLTHVNMLIHYHFALKNFDKINAPFYKKKDKTFKSKQQLFVKKIEIKLVSVFDKRAKLKLLVFVGNQLIKEKEKWVEIHDKIYNCVVKKITLTKVVLKCPDKTLVKTLNIKIPNIKEK